MAFYAVRSKAVVLLLFVDLMLIVTPIVGFCKLSLWDSVIVLCFVVRFFLSILVLQSS